MSLAEKLQFVICKCFPSIQIWILSSSNAKCLFDTSRCYLQKIKSNIFRKHNGSSNYCKVACKIRIFSFLEASVHAINQSTRFQRRTSHAICFLMRCEILGTHRIYKNINKKWRRGKRKQSAQENLLQLTCWK